MKFYFQEIESPVGQLYLIAGEGALCGIVFRKTWSKFKERFEGLEEAESPVLREARRQLAEYFSGKREAFDLPMKLDGTVFQNKVWSSLAKIPFGKTITYKQQAVSIKSPAAARAVGRTNGLNPFCIVLPCHRVLGSSGALTGYAGGLKAKKYLLDLEGSKKNI
jgi:methylated-DNA-[protein]-cysteine S-methyltransferase